MMGNPIRVILCDDHPLVLEGISAVLAGFQHIQVLAVATDADSLMALASEISPDVVLLDVNLGKASGLDLISALRVRRKDVRVIMLSMHAAKEYISAAVLNGADGYLLKDISGEELVTAIEAVFNGSNYFSSSVANSLIHPAPRSLLTPRESEILGLVAAGLSSQSIATSLNLSALTVDTHRRNIKKKLNVSTTAELVRHALLTGTLLRAPT